MLIQVRARGRIKSWKLTFKNSKYFTVFTYIDKKTNLVFKVIMLLDRKGTEVEYKQVISTSVNTEIISPFPYIYNKSNLHY